jgi:hypothetical protein
MRKRNFVVDYEIVGTMQLMARSAESARARAEKLLADGMRDLQDASTYCEAETWQPIDIAKRIAGIA